MIILIECSNIKLLDELKEYTDECSTFFKTLFDTEEASFKICVYDSRESFDKVLGRKTESWEVGNTRNNIIHILSKEIFESQSSHKKEEFNQILKHEICHIFFFARFKGSSPVWLNEGLSSFYGTPKKGSGLEKNIEYLKTLSLDKIYSQEEFRAIDSKIRYELVFAIIKKMVDDYGELKLSKFIKTLEPPLTKEKVEKSFEKIFLKKTNDFFLEWIEKLKESKPQ